MINRFTQQNQMEYFDADYCEEIVKNVNYINNYISFQFKSHVFTSEECGSG